MDQKGHTMDQKGLKVHEKGKKSSCWAKNNCYLAELWGIPPLNGKSFRQKKLSLSIEVQFTSDLSDPPFTLSLPPKIEDWAAAKGLGREARGVQVDSL